MEAKRFRPGRGFFLLALLIAGAELFASPFYSPTWGFRLDPPDDFRFSGGDGKNTFSFQGPDGAAFDVAAHGSRYSSVKALAEDTRRRLKSGGEASYFTYRRKEAALLELRFAAPDGRRMSGWCLCVELGGNSGAGKATLLAAAYGPEERRELQSLYLSLLDSIAPEEGDRLAPGPVTEFSFPRKNKVKAAIPGTGAEAWIYREDAEAAQSLVDREFAVLRRYENSPLWKEAWTRFYRAVYRDSFERLEDAAFVLERFWNVPAPGNAESAGNADGADNADAALAQKALSWVQSFKYERNLEGSDFVNLVSAAFEGRGDCDSRALLWALTLNQADIPAAIMVSREYGHAMGLADIAGMGARFETGGRKWLVAETTAPVTLGLIRKDISAVSGWLGIVFE